MNAIRTNLTGGQIAGAVRIAAWVDGDYDNLIIEWWALSGSFVRTEYNRGTTCTRYQFEPIGTENFARLQRLAA